MNAILSPCGLYRYKLAREWGTGHKLAFIMLNPSTADAEQDDPTIRRCMRFARDTSFDGIEVGNLFAWRATKRAELTTVPDPIGPDNDAALIEVIKRAPIVVCAWGDQGALRSRDRRVLKMICETGKTPHCLRITNRGYPEHPLYLPANLRPVPIPRFT